MIEIPAHPNFRRNQERAGDSPYCVVCGKKATDTRLPRVHMWYGTQLVTEVEAAELVRTQGWGGEMGYWPIGRDCLRQHPELQPYVIAE